MTNLCKPCAIDPNAITSVGDCVLNADGTPIAPVLVPGACVPTPIGGLCPVETTCSPWSLLDGPEDCIMASYITEQLNISGAILNVYKLLGVHEQGLLQDVTGIGQAFSGGDLGNNPASNAFDKYITEWRSAQTGATVISGAYIGYDFGPIRLANGRVRYGIETAIMKDISSFKIMQGCESANRVTKARIERSENGIKWYGVGIIDLPDCDGLVTINFKRTVPSRYWRIRPIAFNGLQNDYWAIRVFQMLEYEATVVSNIQDKLLLENRDRDYLTTPIILRAAYQPQETPSIFIKIGMNQMQDIYMFSLSFQDVVRHLGRPFVIGDILMVPSERQYSSAMRPVEKYLEVTDVFWGSSGYTPLYVPLVQKITAKPLLASQETQNIAGKLTADIDSSGLFDINDGTDGKLYQDYMDINDTTRAEYKKHVPEKGIDYANSPLVSAELRNYAKKNPNMDVNGLSRHRGPYGIDAMPPNGLPYTQGDEFPVHPANNDYHRLTYDKIGVDIPVRLHKYSYAKSRWIYLETDVKAIRDGHRPYLQQYITTDGSASDTPLDQIDAAIKPST